MELDVRPTKRSEETSSERRIRRARAYNPMKRMADGRTFCDGCMDAVHIDEEGRCPLGHTREAMRAQVAGLEGLSEEAVV